VVTEALEARTKAGIKVRQPIASVSGPELEPEFASIVTDELNAKSYEVKANGIEIDTELTQELIAEGAVRELMRAVQGARKKAGLEPQDRIVLEIETNDAGTQAISGYHDLVIKTVGADELRFTETAGEEVVAGDYRFTFAIVTN
jgi:isoleucyl-tRNA synthetase